MRCSKRRPALPPPLMASCNDEDHFHTVAVRPIAAFSYEAEAAGSQGKHVNLVWATKLARDGASLAPPPSADTMPLVVTPTSPKLDVAIRNMLTRKVLVVRDEIRAAFPLTIAPMLDGTYDAVQDFGVWVPRYPRRNYIKLLVAPQTLQRISPFDKMIKIKLTDMFGQLSISAEMQLFCGVHYRGCYFTMTRLPPRHPRSAHIAQRWVEVVGDVLERRFDVYSVMYQDEWLIHAMDFNEQEIIDFIENHLGVDINKDKSVLKATTELEFFGLRVHSAKQTVRINDETRDVMISCMKNIDQHETRERETVACLWWWVAYHHRLPRIIEYDIVDGKADLLSIVMQKFDIFSPRELKRARRKIFIYADVLKGRIIAYAPEFNVEIDEKIRQLTSSTSPETAALLSAMGSAKWALNNFVPDKVDLMAFVNCPEAHKELTRGSYSVIQPIMASFIKLYKRVRSRNVFWHSTQSSASVKELLDHINDLDEQTPLCELVTKEVSDAQRANTTGKVKGRQGTKLDKERHKPRRNDCVPLVHEHSSESRGASSLNLRSSSTEESHSSSENEDSSDLVDIEIEECSSLTSSEGNKSVKSRISPNMNDMKCISPFPGDETDSSCTSFLPPHAGCIADGSVGTSASLETQQTPPESELVSTPPNNEPTSPVSVISKYELTPQYDSLSCGSSGNVSTYESPQTLSSTDENMACGLSTASRSPSLFDYSSSPSPGMENEPPKASWPSLSIVLNEISDKQPTSSPLPSNNLISQNKPTLTIVENSNPRHILQSCADLESLMSENMPSTSIGERIDILQASPSEMENPLPESMYSVLVGGTVVAESPAPSETESVITGGMSSVLGESSLPGSPAASEIENLIDESMYFLYVSERSMTASPALSEMESLMSESVSSVFVGESDVMTASPAISGMNNLIESMSSVDGVDAVSTTPFPSGMDSLIPESMSSVDGATAVSATPFPSGMDNLIPESMSSVDGATAVSATPFPSGMDSLIPESMSSVDGATAVSATPFPSGMDNLIPESMSSVGGATAVSATPFPSGMDSLIPESMSSVDGATAASATPFLSGMDNPIPIPMSAIFVGESVVTIFSGPSISDNRIGEGISSVFVEESLVTSSQTSSESTRMPFAHSTLAYTGNSLPQSGQTAFVESNSTTPVFHECPSPQGGHALFVEGSSRINNIFPVCLGNEIPLYQSDNPIPLGGSARIYLVSVTDGGPENSSLPGGMPSLVDLSPDVVYSAPLPSVAEDPTMALFFSSAAGTSAWRPDGPLANHSLPISQIDQEAMPLGEGMPSVYISVINNFSSQPLPVESVGSTLACLQGEVTPAVQLQTGVTPTPAPLNRDEAGSLPIVTRPETNAVTTPVQVRASGSGVAEQLHVIDDHVVPD